MCKNILGGGRDREDGAQLFLVLSSDRTKGNGHKWEYRKSHLNILPPPPPLLVRVVKHWHCLPQETERLWSLHHWRYSKPDWTQPWASCSSWLCSELGGWTRWSSGSPSSHNEYMIVWTASRGKKKFLPSMNRKLFNKIGKSIWLWLTEQFVKVKGSFTQVKEISAQFHQLLVISKVHS